MSIAHTASSVNAHFIKEAIIMKIMDQKEFDAQNVFGLGQANTACAQYFTGDSFLNPLTRPQDGLFLANVTFEPGCRTTGTSTMRPRAAGRCSSARPARAGIRKKAKRP